MAIKVETLEVVVDADTKRAQSNLKNVGVAAAGAVAAFKIVSKVVGEMVKAWAVQEKAIIKVESALKATGQEVTQSTKGIKRFASEMQSATNIGDETSLALVGVAISMGRTSDEAMLATRTAAGLSDALGMDLNASLRAVVNAQQGNYQQLQRYIPALKGVTDETEAWRIINEAAESGLISLGKQTETISGQVQNLKNRWGDYIEQLGRVISLDPANPIDKLSKALERVTARQEQVNDLTEKYQSLSEEQKQAISDVGMTTLEWANNVALTNRGLAMQAKLVKEIAAVTDTPAWSPERSREYWETYTTGVLEANTHLSAFEQIERNRANTLASSMTEFADLNLLITERVNLYYDEEQAILTKQLAEDAAAEARREQMQKEREESAERLTMIQAETAAFEKKAQITAKIAESVGSSIGDLINSEMSFAEVAKELALDTISSLLRALGAEYAIRAAAAFAKSIWPPNPAGFAQAAQLGAVSAAAYAGSGLVKSFAVGTPPGGYVVPPGFENDSFPVSAASGEKVTVERAGSSSTNVLYANLSIDGYQFGKVITRLFDDRKATIKTRIA